jgi:CheY-like chemotaxis protein/two-component sensor histidine kinase
MQWAGRREAMGDLAAGVAHNFNNMLASILPNLELALDQAPAEIAPFLTDAQQAARSAADLVRQVMAFARNDGVEAPSTPIDLAELVAETVRFCSRTFDRRIEIDAQVAVEPIHVLAPSANLRQIVMNLCINARDALDGRPSPRLGLRLALDPGDATTAVLSVEDNGAGMSPETLRHLGEPFFTTKPPGRGTGLGLASVYGIVRDAGGQIRCDSREDHGTTFTVRLPCWQDAVLADRAHDVPLGQYDQYRVLIVDDEPLVRMALRRQLQGLGCGVLEAANGRDGLSLIEAVEGPLSLAVVDVSMPVMNGHELLQHLNARWPSLPVVMLSGHLGPGVTLDGAARVLLKPIGLRELRDMLAVAVPPAGDVSF